MESGILVAVLLLAFVNGANDNFKGVATLYGSGVLPYRRALGLATVSVALGSLLSVVLAAGLVKAFSGKGVIPAALLDTPVLFAVAAAAAATVPLATRAGAPISTTYSLVRALRATSPPRRSFSLLRSSGSQSLLHTSVPAGSSGSKRRRATSAGAPSPASSSLGS